MTGPTVDVLRVLCASDSPVWGLRVIKESERSAGTVYPVLERLERAGWVSSSWDDDPTRRGPRRRYYELTVDGAVAAVRVVARYDARARSAAVAAVRTA